MQLVGREVGCLRDDGSTFLIEPLGQAHSL
jgi:hypothetical protein